MPAPPQECRQELIIERSPDVNLNIMSRTHQNAEGDREQCDLCFVDERVEDDAEYWSGHADDDQVPDGHQGQGGDHGEGGGGGEEPVEADQHPILPRSWDFYCIISNFTI